MAKFSTNDKTNFNQPQPGISNNDYINVPWRPDSYRQDFNEIDYNKYIEQGREIERRAEETERRMREAQRHHEENRHQIIIEQERQRRAQPMPFQPIHNIDLAEILGRMHSGVGNKTKKEKIIERLAIKFCFFQQRIMSIQTNLVLGGHADASDRLKSIALKVSVPALLEKVSDAIIQEARNNEISKAEIITAVKKMLTTTSELSMAQTFINNFLGAVAIKVYKANPNIIKDTGARFAQRPQTQPDHNADYDLHGDYDVTGGMEDIRRIIADMTERQERERRDIEENGTIWQQQIHRYMNYPAYIQHYEIPVGQEPEEQRTSLYERLQEMTRRIRNL